jgi:hypothetical protein
MLQTMSPHIKIELDDDQQLALVNVYRLLIQLAEKPAGENLQSNRAVGDEIRIKELAHGQTEFFYEEVLP